jgi:hypothetical protein
MYEKAKEQFYYIIEFYSEDFNEDKVAEIYGKLSILEEKRLNQSLKQEFTRLAGDKKAIFPQT